MRSLAAREPIPLDKLGMTARNLREMKAIAAKPYGLILVMDPTGSGPEPAFRARPHQQARRQALDG